jgi:prepilin-type processing-associated H-X9-DG protein
MLLALVVGAAGFAAWDFLKPEKKTSPGLVLRTQCGSNLWQIGQGLLRYAERNGGKLPARFDQLISDLQYDTDVFICPATKDGRALGADLRSTLADFAKKGHCSFIYTGGGLGGELKPDLVLAYEMLSNHAGDGANVLYGDGQVRWLAHGQVEHRIKELAAGHNPPRPSASAGMANP